MKTRPLPLLIAGLLGSLQFSAADTIILKNGETLEGRVLREEGENYVLEVKFSSTIREQKIVPKAEVKSIEKEEPDLKAFEKIADFVPTPPMLSAADYEARILKTEEFIKANPKSSKVEKAKENLDVLGEELEVVRSGGIKFGEEMVTDADYKANAYEFDAKIAESQIKESVSRRDLIGALRQFSAYEKTFLDAEGRDGLATLISQVLTAYGNSIDSSLASIETRMAKRQSGLEQMSPEDRSQTQRALDEESAKIAARLESEKASGENWITPDAFNKTSLEEARRQVDAESQRLENKPNTNPLPQPVAETYRVSWGKVISGTDDEKRKAIDEAKANRLPEIYVEKLRERAGLPKQ